MKNSYSDLINQSFKFPQDGFQLRDGQLVFNSIPIQDLIDKHGTPFTLFYLPKISQQIQKARNWFEEARQKHSYQGKYHYCYCTKSSHFSHSIMKALEEGVPLETSSEFDIDLIWNLYYTGDLDSSIILIHNGYKTDAYLQKIGELIKEGFENCTLVMDSVNEIKRVKALAKKLKKKIKIGIRMAIGEEPAAANYTSRLGIRPSKILDLYKNEIEGQPLLDFCMLHFFVDAGIKDNMYYWGEFRKALAMYVNLKKECSDLNSFNLGGGFPIRNHLGFEYNYAVMVDKIVGSIAEVCRDENIAEPDIFTEFGKFTVGESGAVIFSVLEQKQQNDAELWYLIDNSLLNTIPDAWAISERFILLPINKWDHEYTRINIGGISCDHLDYYNSEDMNQQLHLPKFQDSDDQPLYLGFFHTGAYQEAISGFGGIKHCLIPSPKYIVIDRDKNGNLTEAVFKQQQSSEEMLNMLGYWE